MRKHINKARRNLSPMRDVCVRRILGDGCDKVDIAVPDSKHVGFYLRWLKDIPYEEAVALRDCLSEVL